jgi:glycosyltransferase involved in cell wall biosynthesis
MRDPLVTVVVTTWNRSGLLAETMRSILAQTFRDFELVVVDNESQDDTAEVVAALGDPRVRYLRHANGGVIAVNRNVGIAEARGSYVAFCDDDDLWEPEKLSVQTGFMEGHADYAMCCGNMLDFGDGRTYGWMVPHRGDRDVDRGTLLEGWHPARLSTVLARRGVLEDVRFREDPSLRSVEDYDLYLRLSGVGRIRFIDRVLGRYRIHAGSASHSDLRDVIAKERIVLAVERDAGSLSEAEYAQGMANLARNHRRASVKQAIKRVSWTKPLYYRLRSVLWRLTHRARTEPR